MLGQQTGLQTGMVDVGVTSGRGMNPDELTALAMRRILFVGPDVPPAIREQAHAFRAQIEAILRQSFAQAQKSQNTTIYNILKNAGEERAAELVRRL